MPAWPSIFQLVSGLVLLRARQAASLAEAPTETINLDLPPEQRWVEYAKKHAREIIFRATTIGSMYEENLGENASQRWFKAAPVGEELMAEYKSIVDVVNDSSVTLRRLVLSDMWHALHAPTFECTGLLATMANGTVIHGRNIDYDMVTSASQAVKHINKKGSPASFYTGIFTKNGKPLVTFVASAGSLGVHTGMRLGGWSFNSNARLVENDMNENLRATESGSVNFPWATRHFLTEIPDYASALKAFRSANFNAPNYFILAGAGPYEGAIVTADRGGKRLPDTPDVQELSAEKGIWHLVQTNEDNGEEPLDRRRGLALNRLRSRTQDQVGEDFVLHEMLAEPTTNSDTLLTWVASPGLGIHHTYPRSPLAIAAGLASRLFHKSMHKAMPQEFDPPPAVMMKRKSSLLSTRSRLH
mmetsp:Transcript_68941/g.156253  ORF Transcript_68941/g.156253 Transcript_68941/m.156253 type:complete len:415 (-) Transcript_68941:80-1324(-)